MFANLLGPSRFIVGSTRNKGVDRFEANGRLAYDEAAFAEDRARLGSDTSPAARAESLSLLRIPPVFQMTLASERRAQVSGRHAVWSRKATSQLPDGVIVHSR